MSGSSAGLLGRVVVRFGAGALALAALFFGTAGTLQYWQAWLYMAVLLIPVSFALVYMLRRDPGLMERRMRGREPRSRQRAVVSVTSLILLLAFVIPGLDQRLGWSFVPAAVVIAADLAVLVGYALFFRVVRENSYAGRTVTVDAGQPVVTTGPYRFVRHPMYVALIVMYVASPLALGSAWAVLPALLLPFVLAARIRDEEQLLTDTLPGYRQYQATTKYRLVPRIW